MFWWWWSSNTNNTAAVDAEGPSLDNGGGSNAMKRQNEDGDEDLPLLPADVIIPINDRVETISPKSINIIEEAEALQYERSRRRKFAMSLGLVSILILLIGVFIVYPRQTEFKIQSFDIDSANSTFYDGDQLMTNWLAIIEVENKNFYPIHIRHMNVTAFLSWNRNDAVGRGHGLDLKFPARKTHQAQIHFEMPVYAPSTGKPSLIGECMRRSEVMLFLKTDIDLEWLHWTGKSFSIETEASVECRVPAMSPFNTINDGEVF